MDGAVVEPVAPQRLQIGGGHLRGAKGQFLSVSNQSLVDRRQWRRQRISQNRFDHALITAFRPEILSVGHTSVMALVEHTDGSGKQLPLHTGQRRIAVH